MNEFLTTAAAVLQRTEPGMQVHGRDMEWHINQVVHPLNGKSRSELVEVIAYLAAQWHGLNDSVNHDAALAMSQIDRIVRDFNEREARK